jgi:uncharacterized protein YndB with AHSA1/START domain
MSKPVRVTRTLHTTPEQIWNALTNPKEMAKWYFDIPGFNPKVGYTFRFTSGPSPEKQYVHLCEVTNAVMHKALSYHWSYDGFEGQSLVAFVIKPLIDGRTRIRVTHTGLETFPTHLTTDFAQENFLAGWRHLLGKSLRDYLKG